MVNKILTKPFRIKKKYDSLWSTCLKKLLKKGLEKKPRERLSIQEFLNHKAFDKVRQRFKDQHSIITSNFVNSEKTKSFIDQKEEQYRMPCLSRTLLSIRDISTQYTSNPKEKIKDKEDMIQKTRTHLIKSVSIIGYYSECIKLLKKGI